MLGALLLIAAVLLVLQAYRLMRQGFAAVQRPLDTIPSAEAGPPVTIHPELLDRNGRLITEELLTVQFSSDNDTTESQSLR